MSAMLSVLIAICCVYSAQAAVCPDGVIQAPCTCAGATRTAGECSGNGAGYVPPVTCWNAVAYENCPCTESNYYGCHLPECTTGMSRGDLCEADRALPAEDYVYGNNYNVNNCPGYYDVFEYICPIYEEVQYDHDDLVFAMYVSDRMEGNTWRDRKASTEITVPSSVQFTGSFEGRYMTVKGTAVSAPFPTSPNDMASTTFVIRFRVQSEPSNKGWIMSQAPDYGWSRALAISDSRLGYIGNTPGNFDSTLDHVEADTWHVLAGTWTQGGSCRSWLDGVAGAARTCSNGDGSSGEERIIIGGRQETDSGHNPSSIDISHALVYDTVLGQSDISEVTNALSGIGCDPTHTCGIRLANGFTCDAILNTWSCRGSGCCGDQYPNKDLVEDTCDTSTLCGNYQSAGYSCSWILADFDCTGTGCCENEGRRLDVSPRPLGERLLGTAVSTDERKLETRTDQV